MLVRNLIVAARNRQVAARNRKGVTHNSQGCTLVFCNSITQMDKLHDEVQVSLAHNAMPTGFCVCLLCQSRLCVCLLC